MQVEKVVASSSKSQAGGFLEFVKILLQAGLIALVLRTFLFQPFNIPSGSLMPSLLIGDYLFVSKYAYGYSRYSFPFSPNLFSGRILGALPKRGDIAVFRYIDNSGEDYIKRVIGLPDDTITMHGEKLSINGQEAKYEFVREYDDELKGKHAYVYNETLPNGVKHLMQTLDHRIEDAGSDLTLNVTVKKGTLFMMGDNRDDSSDSRVWGGLPLENLEGRAEIVFFSIKTLPGRQMGNQPETEPIWQFWRWPWTVRWDRLFMRIH